MAARFTVTYFVRAADAHELAPLKARVQACFEAGALATGCRLQVEWGDTDWGRFYDHGGLIHLVMSATGQLADDDLFAAGYVNTVQADPYAVLFNVIATVDP